VLVEHRLAVLDLVRQPTRGDGIPPVRLGQPARRGDDETTPGSSITGAAILDGHN
jgi:hypothetical protein